MKTIFKIIPLFIILISCKEENIIISKPNYRTQKYTDIYLDSKLRIIKSISVDSNNIFINEWNYIYSDSIIIKTYKNPSSDIFISKYFLGVNGYAKNCYQYHLKNNDTISIDTSTYSYDEDNRLIRIDNSSILDWPFYLGYYENGNLEGWNAANFSGYCDTINLIDIYNLGYCDGIAGVLNPHLIKQVYWTPNNGPSMPAEPDNFSYILDKDGFVIKMFNNGITEFRYIKNYISK